MDGNDHGIAAQQPEVIACNDPGTPTSGESRPLPDTAECCIGCSNACITNQVTSRPPCRRHPHRADRSATICSPRPPSASRPARVTFSTPGPPRPVTSTRTTPARTRTATVTVLPAPPEPLYRTLFPTARPRPGNHPGTRRAQRDTRSTQPRTSSRTRIPRPLRGPRLRSGAVPRRAYWFRPMGSRYQHGFSTGSGNDGKQPAPTGQSGHETGPPSPSAGRPVHVQHDPRNSRSECEYQPFSNCRAITTRWIWFVPS
jgi:hypothetical protein